MAQPARTTAFEAEALDHLPLLRRTARSLSGRGTDAEDLVQEAYVRALQASPRLRPDSNLRAWMLTILRNLARNQRRDSFRAQRHWESDPDAADAALADAPAATISPEQQLLNRSVAPQLRDALEALPKALRDAVWLRDVEDLTYQEMADRLRIPLGTVMSRISRGRRQLHDRLAAIHDPSARRPR
jgi:RNA polymerase sigma-70 factor (ECF subfamily)